MKLYLTTSGPVVQAGGKYASLGSTPWDDLVNDDDLLRRLAEAVSKNAADGRVPLNGALLPPVGQQEVWAAGVTYLRSRDARMEESKAAGGGSFYDRVYDADRPELFFKATPHRVVGHDQYVRLRKDSKWNVPEPELVLLVNRRGRIVGYTIGNDMSSRDIEGENPLYLPQAKVYDGSCALGPCVLVASEPPPTSTEIRIEVRRGGEAVFTGRTSLAQIKRGFEELVEYLFRDSTFPVGCFLLTGTGIVPPDSFTLRSGDEIAITIDPIGILRNVVA